MTDIDKYFDVAVNLVKEAGELITKNIFGRNKCAETKENASDFVTETDKAVEKLLIEGLKRSFPDHKFIGEESTAAGTTSVLTDAPTWIIDPVDGTFNFVYGNPTVCISVALAVNKIMQIGIVSVPVPQFLFTAKKGQGAYLNGRKIHSSNTTDISEALVTIEFSLSKYPHRHAILRKYFDDIMSKVNGVRAYGSAAYNMAMVALGGSDAYFEIGIHVWDFAAGLILVEEAGGVVLDPSGEKLDLMSRRMLCASTESLAKQLSALIHQDDYPKRDDA